MKGGEPLTMREASFISSLMGHAQHIDAATVRFTMHIDGSLDGQINLKSEYTRELERAERERAGTNALSARGDGVPPRRSRSSSPDAPPAKRASSAGSSVSGYDSETPDEITNEALFRACRAYGLGEQFNAAAQDEGTFAEWLDELPIEVAAATARLLKHHARSGAWIEIHPGSPSQAPRAGRDRDRGPHSSPNCLSDVPEPSDCSD